jgi:excisionase family DNA binding protein
MALLLDISDAAQTLGGISKVTVRRLIATGQLPIVRLGRRVLIEETALVDLVERNKTRRVAREAVCVGTESEAGDGLSGE